MISFYGSNEVLDKVLGHSQATVGSDGIFGGRPHPRLHGTYPRFIDEYVHVKRKMNLSEAIRKVTGFPASILGLDSRGLLKKGHWADIVLLEPEAIGSSATYEEPERYPEGIPYVMVNGELVVNNGKTTGSLPGQALRK
jgi:N-acyl-D-amino-acid deacylase